MAFERKFEIEKISHHPGEENFTKADVVFSMKDDMLKGEVVQHVAITVRLSVPETSTIEELHEAVYRKAVDQLHRALAVSEGKTARQLRQEVLEDLERDQRDLDNSIASIGST